MAQTLRLNSDGFSVWINYLTSNLRITIFEWNLPDREDVITTVTCVIYDTDISEIVPIYVKAETSPSSGSQNVPGARYRMVWVEDADEVGGGYYDLPPNLVYSFGMEFSR
jgi:hypothetical protein